MTIDTRDLRLARGLFALVLAGFLPAAAQAIGHAVDASGDLYRIDPAAAVATPVGATGIPNLVEGLAADPSGNLYATTTAGDIFRLDTETGAGTLLGNHGAGNLEGLDYVDGILLGIAFSTSPQTIYAISLDTVGTSPVVALDRSDILSISSLAVRDRRTAFFQGVLTIGVGSLFSVDLETGQTTFIGDLDDPVTALDFDGDTLYGLGFSGRVSRIDTGNAEMTLIGATAGLQAWLGMDLPARSVSLLECAGPGSGGDSFVFRQVRFQAESGFTGMELRLQATAPGDYFFDVELRRSDGVLVTPERVVPGAAIGLTGDFSTTPYRPVAVDFGPVAVAGPETFTARIVNVRGPAGALVFETYGFGNTPCPGVEEIDTTGPPPPAVVGDPAGFRLLADPDAQAPLLVCQMPGIGNGDLAGSRGVRFTTGRDFRATELRFNSNTAGGYSFDVELRRSSGFTAPVERIAQGIGVEVPGAPGVQPFRAASAAFGDLVRVVGPETFTLKMTNVSGPGGLLFETYGIGNEPCPDVEQTDQNNVAVPTVRGDPAGFRLLSDREVPLQTQWCTADGASAFNVLVRGVRFTTAEPFTALELVMDGSIAGEYSLTAELRRSAGFLAAPERVVPGVVVNVAGTPSIHPYTGVARIDFGTDPVPPGTFTLKFSALAGPSTNLFFGIDGGACSGGDVEATLQNNVATPTPLGSPARFRLLLQPDTDGDGVNDFLDNCLLWANPEQRDTDGDGIGNACDGDFNNDCIVNPSDLGVMRANFFGLGDLDTDMNGDGVTNPIDLGRFRSLFFLPPGPAAPPNLCP